MDTHDPQTEAQIQATMGEVKANFPWIDDRTARTVAEDQVLRGVPAHSSELVEEARERKNSPEPA